jgi:hypothetical protein
VRTATLGSVGIRKRRVEFRTERLEIHRDPKGLKLVAEVAQTLQPIIDIKKTPLPAHRITSDPSSKRESEMLKLGQVFRSVHLFNAPLQPTRSLFGPGPFRISFCTFPIMVWGCKIVRQKPVGGFHDFAIRAETAARDKDAFNASLADERGRQPFIRIWPI